MSKKAKIILAKFSLRKYKNNPQSQLAYANKDLDRKLIHSLSKSKIPSWRQLKYVSLYLSPRELRLIQLAGLVIVLSLTFWSVQFYRQHVELSPIVGGEYIEGLVGSPRFVNPLYGNASDVDRDLTKLVFSSLFTHDADGRLVNDLALSSEVSEDNKHYTIKIRTDAKWHSGDPLTVDDIVYTFNVIKDADYKSSLRKSFLGVTIEKIDDETVRFNLEESYAAFLDFLTFGIIPESLWSQIPPETATLAELNLKPIGSGPYQFKSLVKDKTGNIKNYSLVLNENYYGQSGFIEELSFQFFVSTEEAINALNNDLIDGVGYLPSYAKEEVIAQDKINFYDLSLPHLTAIFFNQKNNPLLAKKNIRQALAMAINKADIVTNIFQGDVRSIDGPILPNNFAYNSEIKKYKFNQIEVAKIFTEAGWEKKEITTEMITKAKSDIDSEDEETKKTAKNILSAGIGSWLYNEKEGKYFVINLTTVDNQDNVQVVEAVKMYWEEVGVKTNLNIVSANEIQFNVIKPRNFEALFYGQVVGSDPDIYVFWHSSQIGEDGLNIANYANTDVDKLLEDARLITNTEERIKKYHEFQNIISEEASAIFMYSPIYTYVQSRKVQGFGVNSILKSSDRFNNITDWYIKTSKKLNF